MSMPIIKTPERAVCRSQAISDIIESIALQETALSHIINAEGEKIQKILAIDACPEDILAVNNSVRSTLDAVAKYEMILQEKLRSVLCDNCSNT